MTESGRTLLGFDYGTQQIGVAVGQELTATSTPLATLASRNENPDWDAITRLIEAWRPAALVVGIPLNMDGTEQPMTESARRFARRLEGRYRLPVHLADERLSTVEAGRLLRESATDSGTRRSRRRRELDEVAAHLILQTWFSQQARDAASHRDAAEES
ncbi:MAG: Holliday junction resolvase RuvX [Gammaproteobacteria bacterium]|nr:Holliday junction resolvase RuvX [Gammaproteobacteria bacterium]